MKIEIFDVEHGQCILVTADNGRQIMVDCGRNSTTGWNPADQLAAIGQNHLQLLIVSNYDEDHVNGLTELRAKVKIELLSRNRSVGPEALESIKAVGGKGGGITSLIEMMRNYTGTPEQEKLDFAGIERRHFWNQYPADFGDHSAQGLTNNLSFVTFLNYSDIHILIPGDLEEEGWQKIAAQLGFLEELGKVNVFVAPHHGRESGFFAPLFHKLRPKIIVISDGKIQYDTQQGVYKSEHAEGISLYPHNEIGTLANSVSGNILTTRRHASRDMPITIQQEGTDPAYVITSNRWGVL